MRGMLYHSIDLISVDNFLQAGLISPRLNLKPLKIEIATIEKTLLIKFERSQQLYPKRNRSILGQEVIHLFGFE
jgi:hypothetical protein